MSAPPAASISGTQATGAVAGTTVARRRHAPHASRGGGRRPMWCATRQLNALANSARGGASTGAVGQHRAWRPWCRCRPSPPTGRAPRRCRSTTRARSSPTTFSFNLPPGQIAGLRPSPPIKRTMAQVHVPISIHGTFAGTAQAVPGIRSSNEPLLILAAICHDLYRAGHSVRELCPSADDPLDPAIGRASARCWRC